MTNLVSDPMLVTKWGEFMVEGGVLFVTFQSGQTWRCIAMGPAMAFKGIDKARKALSHGIVERLMGDEVSR